MMKNLLCPACHGIAVNLLEGETRQAGGQAFKLAQCATCGTAFTTPCPEDSLLRDFYSTSFSYELYQAFYPAKCRESCERLKEYRPLLGKHILDFGGGLGYFSQAARDLGYNSVTYDPYTSNALSLSSKSWDTVVVLHTLEHANDPDRMCQQIKRMLVPGGRIILAVPNFCGRGYRERGMRWVWAQPPLVHLVHFTEYGLTTLLKRHGFTDIQVSYHERWNANYICDIKLNWLFGFISQLQFVPMLRKVAIYRRCIAGIETRLRYHWFQKSLACPLANPVDYAELQVTAVYP